MLHLKQLQKHAGIETSIVKPYPKGVDGWPGWQFNLENEKEDWYEGATVDKLFGSKYMHELYFKADKAYKGKYSVPVLWDKKLGTIVNNESLELLRDMQTAFNGLLPQELASINLYPKHLSKDIERIGEWMQRDLNTGVYKAGFAPDQETYEKNLPAVFAALNKLEKITAKNGGPYILGKQQTELDVRVYATIVRFDTVYDQVIPFYVLNPYAECGTDISTALQMQPRYNQTLVSGAQQLAQAHVLEPRCLQKHHRLPAYQGELHQEPQ